MSAKWAPTTLLPPRPIDVAISSVAVLEMCSTLTYARCDVKGWGTGEQGKQYIPMCISSIICSWFLNEIAETYIARSTRSYLSPQLVGLTITLYCDRSAARIMLVYNSLALFFGLAGALKSAPSGPFRLYAYGKGIVGAPVFSSQDSAYVGDRSKASDSDATQVVFTAGPNTEFLGSSVGNSTAQSRSWSDKPFFIPSPSSTSHGVGFTDSTSGSDISTSGFIFDGQFVTHLNEDGRHLETLWYVVPTQSNRVWSLRWNSTGDESEGQVMVSLRSVGPSHPFR
ncbi:hypothetical protein GGR57DRAFT_181245 [Xylariaceae sp. FL1272]|nr:hypothetical protein GGR57DRAFT_181245 [Xylariaceae sp. FL1272]